MRDHDGRRWTPVLLRESEGGEFGGRCHVFAVVQVGVVLPHGAGGAEVGGFVFVGGGEEVDETLFEVDKGFEAVSVCFVVGDAGAEDSGGWATAGGDDDGCGFQRVIVVVIEWVNFWSECIEYSVYV